MTAQPTTKEPVPPEHLIKLIGGYTAADYVSIAEHFFEIFVKYGALKPTDRVLDVGCGCGRMAMPLTRFLTSGSYEGFDIVDEAVEWCQKNITPRHPTFHFQLANVRNDAYAANAPLPATEFRFPFSDNTFDFTFLTSVFTHMLPPDVEHYTREVSRTLKPGGTAVITFFLLNQESERLMNTPAAQLTIPHAFGGLGLKVGDRARPEAVVGYPEQVARKILADNGLTLQEPIYFGSWCGREGAVTYQDVTVSKK